MADSNFTLDRTSLITRSLRRLGVTSPTTNQIANGVSNLNGIIGELDPQCEWAWAVSGVATNLTLTSGNRSYSVGTPPTGIKNDIVKIVSFAIAQGSNRKYFRVIEKEEFASSFELETAGEPYLVHLQKATTYATQTLFVLPTPGANYTAEYFYQRSLLDFDASTDNPDMPREWTRPLELLLTADLAEEYGRPLDDRTAKEIRANAALKRMLKANASKITPIRVRSEYF